MIQFISEFGLPKEFSKKKKFELYVGMYISNDEWKDTELQWNINLDKNRVFLTVDECVKYTIKNLLIDRLKNSNSIDNALDTILSDITNGYIAISAFVYPTTTLNYIPLTRDPQNNTIDCNWDQNTLSFDFTFRDNKWEDLNVSTLKIAEVDANVENETIQITKCNVYPVVDVTAM